ncbi:hypothetical protein A2997_02325 [Candidatus Nomurabacteria bacterium RIFCSPLOWO2_01_FULL_36_10b]|uniref:Uncharacterized protein n=1 Tax=Candidatus Nomurabacteria bacterium RIFCSPLOWO2_01_FULL_36_10b TaxID=1801766 RepID=A0A1F6WN50_9BACT|nr:MAG: hypothetical protein A2997_02325 [Candidatus Nomurabacteria bacterium RIFCSPLOWO2_01_FULL_36_10b]
MIIHISQLFRKFISAHLRPTPSDWARLRQSKSGDDVRKFEPAYLRKTLSYGRIDKIIRQLRRHYNENPAYFDVPAFAQKVY